jgi:hypothetical protein
MSLTRERVELAILDSLEQTGAAAGDLDTDTRLESLALVDVEREDLADEFRTEFGVTLSAAEIAAAERVGDIVDLVLSRAPR